jgi:hypothetical protein
VWVVGGATQLGLDVPEGLEGNLQQQQQQQQQQ